MMETVSEDGQELPGDREHLFGVIVSWSLGHGASRIGDLPGCWERTLADPRDGTPRWHVAVNGHEQATEAGPVDGMRCDVPPFTAYVWWNGWLAGDVNPAGWQLAAGEGANEATFRAAIAADKGTATR